MNDEARPIAWAALEKGTPVATSDGQEVGKVSSVIADEQKDIFSGITFRHGFLDREHFIPAEKIANMTSGRVELQLSSQETENLEPYDG
jgi:uncharacterized protein YrrD